VPDQVASGVTTPIDNLARQVCADAHWTGAAADAFVQHWGQAAVGAAMVAGFYNAAGQVVEDLSENLDQVDQAMHRWAAEMQPEGAVIDSDGSPGTPPAGPSVAVDATNEYAALHTSFLNIAQGFRLETLRTLVDHMDALQGVLTGGDVTPYLSGHDATEFAGLMRSIVAVPAAVDGYLKGRRNAAWSAYDELAKQWREAGGGRGGPPPELKARRTAALRDWKALDNKLATAMRAPHPVARFLDFSIGKALTAVAPGLKGLLGDDGETAADAAKLSRGTKFLRALADVPVLDVAAGAVSTVFMARDDISKGESPGRAYTEAATSNALAIGAGAGVAYGVGIGLGAIGAGPVVAVGAAAVVGGAIAVGVGEFAYQAMHEDWSQDFHDHGVIVGLGDGIADSGKRTGEAIADGAKSLWHSVFG
jgi:hypothetical protein